MESFLGRNKLGLVTSGILGSLLLIWSQVEGGDAVVIVPALIALAIYSYAGVLAVGANVSVAGQSPVPPKNKKPVRPERPDDKPAPSFVSAVKKELDRDRSGIEFDVRRPLTDEIIKQLRNLYATVEIAARSAAESADAVRSYAELNGLEAYEMMGKYFVYDPKRRRIYATTVKRSRRWGRKK